MTALASGLVIVVALIHAYIVVLEMVLWTRPQGRAAFGLSREQAEETKVLAANQGLYNGFLVAGLVVALIGPEDLRFGFAVFFLACVIVAGLYGAATVSRRIIVVQSAPAALALAAVVLAR